MTDELTPEKSEELLNRAFDPIKPPPEFKVTIKTLIADTWREAQLAKGQEDCPDCKGTGKEKFTKHVLTGLPCPICKGKGKVLKASPDREKIADIIRNWIVANYPIGSQTFPDLAAKLIDLFPDCEACADGFISTHEKATNDVRKQEEIWIAVPTKRGNYWLSPFVAGKYIHPRIISVIDYQRPDRGLEVQYDFPRDSIPVEIFCKEYYPEAKWMFIQEPNWQALEEG